ncbi:MAG: hypothetical protein FWC43_00745 [Planctomycetaceae bacterium]|nr:hypothetical protein [Planctomycetaceae bacterium]
MSFYQQFVKHFLHPLDLYRSRGYAQIGYLREFEKSQFYAQEQLKEIAWDRLVRILEHAYQKIPYYRSSMDQAGVHPGDIKSESDLLAIPLLEKTAVQKNLDSLVNPDFPKHLMSINQTGGSTGTPVKFYVDKDCYCSRSAATVRHDRWAGYDIGFPKGVVWAREFPAPTSLKSQVRSFFFPRSLFYNTGTISDDSVFRYNEQLKRFRPPVIVAYASAMGLLASVLKKHGVKAYQPKGIITSSETLEPENRLLIEEVFGCKVFNRLGCSEFSVIASECERHDGLHIMQEGLYIEIVKQGKHAAPGELGELVITDLRNVAMPLIRYRIKDTATWMTGTCSCGRGLARITNIAGRVAGFLVAADGSLCSGIVFATTVIAHRPSLKQVQILQTERGRITFKIACGSEENLTEEDRNYLREHTSLNLGKEMAIDYEFVDHIPHEPSGKYLLSKSTITGGFI